MTESRAAASQARGYLIFREALEVHGTERERYLESSCAGDRVLRAEVDELLALATVDPAATGALLPRLDTPEESLSGESVGRYRLLERLGAGGMGVVYRAVRTDEVGQIVAIKLLSSWVTDSLQRSFEREAQILARLEHPAVARLIDAGIKEHRPWFAIEFVGGTRIDEFCDREKASCRTVIQLMIQLAEAVAAAHRMLVVHSDIKPSNVLVTLDGAPKLIDFGISTALREVSDDRAATIAASRLFSPGYAAPEQVAGEAITIATDVFGLGSLAYRLLSGVPPHAQAHNPIEYLLAVSQRDIDPPSRAARLAGRSEQQCELIRGDLDAILGKALERDPKRRYASAGDLQADLQRYLDERPVAARPASNTYRAAKFLRRHPVGSLLGTLAGVAALGATAVLAWQAHELAIQRDAAQASASRAQRMSSFLVSMLQSADPQLGGRRDVSVAEVLDAGAAQARNSLADDPRIQAQMLSTIAQTDYTLGRFHEGVQAANDAVTLLSKDPRAAAQLAEALRLKGKLFSELGDRAGAASQLARALELLRGVPYSERAQAALMKELGMTLQRDADPTIPEDLYREAIKTFARLGIDDAEYGDTLISLGELLLRKGDFDGALAVEQQGLAMMLRHQSSDNPDVLGAKLAVAEALESLHRLTDAEAMLRQLVSDRARVLGVRHLDTLIARLSLSANLRMQQRYDEAIALAQNAGVELEGVVDGQHTIRLFALSMRGLAQCLGGNAVEGLEAVKEAARIRTARFGISDRRASMGRALVAICDDRLRHRTDAVSAAAADPAWRPLANASYADVPALMARLELSSK